MHTSDAMTLISYNVNEYYVVTIAQRCKSFGWNVSEYYLAATINALMFFCMEESSLLGTIMET